MKTAFSALTKEEIDKAYIEFGQILVLWSAKKGIFLSAMDFARDKSDIARYTNITEERLLFLYGLLTLEVQKMAFNKPRRHVIKGFEKE